MTRGLWLAACSSVLLAHTPSVFESDREFRLRTHLDAGLAIEIEGVNGDLVAETSTSGDVEVLAIRKNGSVRPMRLSVREHGGGTTVSAIQHDTGDMEIRFHVRVPAGVRFVGRTQNGRVQVKKLRSAVRVRTVNGDIDIESDSSGQAETVNGSIRASLKQGGRLETVNGDVTVRLPATPDAEIDARAVYGSLTAAIPFTHVSQFTHNHWHGRFGGVPGGPTYDVRTVNGDIHLEAAAL
ncbi:MAG: DUF4097 family beta strand repeat-containing protein [Bryobacteraceae bacterium]